MLGDAKIFSYLHNVYEAGHLQVYIRRFKHTVARVIHLYLFNNNIHIYYIVWIHALDECIM
jgi:hypothetical protein